MATQTIEIHESSEIRERLAEIVTGGQAMVLSLPDISDANEKGIGTALELVLERYNRTNMHETLYVCIRELVANAIKANAKHIFFAEQGLDITRHGEYEIGISQFKKNLNEVWIREYFHKAKAKGLDVLVYITHDHDGLRLEVVNNIEITPEDEKRIRQKFAKGMSYDNLVSFYLEHGDDTEGEGIGFALSVLLLRGEQINPALFRVGSNAGKTVARIEVPFTEHFRSLRGSNPGPWTDK